MEKVFFLIVQSFNYMIYYEDSCVKKSVFSLRGIVGMASGLLAKSSHNSCCFFICCTYLVIVTLK